MIPKDVDEIEENDLQELIENSVSERKTLEYKLELSTQKDSEKKEFLADISSFANASGGDVIYGMKEEDALPKELTGLQLDGTGVEREMLRIEQLMADGIRPRIVGHKIKEIPLSNKRFALVVRIPKSWQSPHRVVFGGHDKFYGRNAKGKYPLDVDELQVAFNLSETINDRIRSFRAGRIAKILSNEGPVSLPDHAKVILHVMPIISFGRPQNYDISLYQRPDKPVELLLGTGTGITTSRRYNFDGILIYNGPTCLSYVQIFKNGIIEAVDAYNIMEHNGKRIIGLGYEERVVEGLQNYLSLLKDLCVDMPMLVALTLTDVQGYAMDETCQRRQVQAGIEEPRRIVEEKLLVPEIEVSSYEEKAEDILRSSFDAVWNAGGFAGSPNYNKSGEWLRNTG